MNVVVATRRYVSDDRYRLRLYEAVAEEVRRVLGLTGDHSFPVQAKWSDEEFRKRIAAVDDLLADLCRVQGLLGRWGNDAHLETLTLGVKRLSDPLESRSGNAGWLAVRWYPVLLLFYAGGIATVATNRYRALIELGAAPLHRRKRRISLYFS